MSLAQIVRVGVQKLKKFLQQAFDKTALTSESSTERTKRFRVQRLERRLVFDAAGLPLPNLIIDPAQIPDLGPTEISLDADGNLFIRDQSTGGIDDRIVLSQASVNNETYLVIEQQAKTIPDPPQGNRAPDPVYILQSLIHGAIHVDLAAGDDLLTINLQNGNPLPDAGLVYDGGTQSPFSTPYDGLVVAGDGSNTAIYRPDMQSNGQGEILIDQRSLRFSGLEPIDIHGMNQLLVELPGNNDFIQLENGTDYFDLNHDIDAVILSGTSQGVPFEPLAIWDVDSLVIDTTTYQGAPTDGVDTVLISSANNAHQILNLTIRTGNGDDLFDLDGRSRFSETITLDSSVGEIRQNILYSDVVLETDVAKLRGAAIGDLDTPIETEVNNLIAESISSVYISEHSDITLTEVTTYSGPIVITAEGSIVAEQVTSENQTSMDDSPDPSTSSLNADIQLTTFDIDADIIVRSIVAKNEADVYLLAADDVRRFAIPDLVNVTSDDLKILSLNQSNDGGGIDLRTQVNDLVLKVTGPFRGDANITEEDSIRLASSDFINDALQLSTENGQILVRASDISVSDPNPTNEGVDRTLDPEMVALGSEGRVRLIAEQNLRIENGVQIFASHMNSTPLAGRVAEADTADAAVQLVADNEIFFGDSVQIQTESGEGIARFFAPRPEVRVIDSSLYLYESTTTDKLTSVATGFGGNLSLEVGRPGEKGLVLDIDWGAPTNRFSQITGINGDDPLVVANHIYTEADILNSTLNGRTSATSPIEVRFSVSHHPTIRIDAPRVIQATVSEEIVGGLVSSTDNPMTVELLENGRAQFIVPNLAIPVRLYFPPPNLPIVEKPILTDPPLTQVPLRDQAAEFEPIPVFELVTRQEYYQIRVLSLDPNDEGDGPTERLPDDIMSSDQLERLLEQLQDGRYQIEYVLGEGNARMLLQFEVRDGVANLIDSGELVDGLKLETMNINSISP